QLTELRLTLPVRSQSSNFSVRCGSVPSYDDGEGLNLELPLAQSAFSPLLSSVWRKPQRGRHRSHAKILARTLQVRYAVTSAASAVMIVFPESVSRWDHHREPG